MGGVQLDLASALELVLARCLVPWPWGDCRCWLCWNTCRRKAASPLEMPHRRNPRQTAASAASAAARTHAVSACIAAPHLGSLLCLSMQYVYSRRSEDNERVASPTEQSCSSCRVAVSLDLVQFRLATASARHAP